MNQTIRLYIDILETRQNKKLEIVKQLYSVMMKIIKIKNVIQSRVPYLSVKTRISKDDNTFEIVYKTSSYPTELIFYLPEKAINELEYEYLLTNDANIILDYIYKVARKEYKRIGEEYNRRSSVMFVRNKSPLRRY